MKTGFTSGNFQQIRHFLILLSFFALFPGLLRSEEKTPGIVVHSIRAVKESEDGIRVHLRWRVDKANASALFVGRSPYPVENAEALRKSWNLTPQGLPPGTEEFLDEDPGHGENYYVVVSLQEIRKSDQTPLIAGENRTVTGIFVNKLAIPEKAPAEQKEQKSAEDRGKKPEVTEKQEKESPVPAAAEEEKGLPGEKTESPAEELYPNVKYLQAERKGKEVHLSWIGPEKNIRVYHVYRGKQPLDSIEAFEQAELIATITDLQTEFVDPSPPEGAVYYGVTYMSIDRQREFQQLKPASSTASYHGKKPKEEKKETPLPMPRRIDAHLRKDQSVEIIWDAIDTPMDGYAIYRSEKPITNKESLNQAHLLTLLPPGAHSYIDGSPEKGYNYYGAIPRLPGVESHRLLVSGKTVTLEPVLYTGKPDSTVPPQNPGANVEAKKNRESQDAKKEESEKSRADRPDDGTKAKRPFIPRDITFKPDIKELSVKQKGAWVELSWRLEGPVAMDHRFLIYRSRSPLTSLDQLEARGKLIGEVPGGEWRFIDQKPDRKAPYYTVLVDQAGMIVSKVRAGESSSMKAPLQEPASSK